MMNVLSSSFAIHDEPPQDGTPTRGLPQQHHIPAAPADQTQPVLTARDLLILQLLARGYTTPQIAAVLETTPTLVDRLIERATQKSGATHHAQAVAIAVRQGLID